MKIYKYIALCAIGILCQIGSPNVFASGNGLSHNALSHFARHRQIRHFQQQMPFKLTEGLSGASALDTTPPMLTALSVGTKVNVTKSKSQLLVNFTATDGLSGLDYIYIGAVGPSGQFAFVEFEDAYPSTSLSQTLALNISPFAEPGRWSVDLVYGWDVAGNLFVLDANSMKAFGNTVFTVINTNPNVGDLTPPRLLRGKVLTPKVFLSTPPIGTVDGMDPYAGVNVELYDGDSTVISGVHGAEVEFCLADESSCFSSYSIINTFGIKDLVFSTYNNDWTPYQATQPSFLTGKYFINHVWIWDQANNEVELQSIVFGGDTDFSQIFPTSVIKIKP